MRFSLRGLTILFLLLFFLTTTLTGFAIYSTSVATIRQLVDERLAEVSIAIAPEGSTVDPALLGRRMALLSRDRDTGDIGFFLADAGGRQIAGNVRLSRALRLGHSNVDVADNIKGLTQGRAYVRTLPGGLRLTVVAETEPFDNYDTARLRIYLIGFGSIVAVVLGGLLVFSRMVSRRITDMRATVDTIVDGNLDERVPMTGDRSEFDQQAEAFNRMLDRIQILMEEIRNVSNDISHELRTPLTRLRGRLALLLRDAETDGVRAGVGGALEDADDLLAMFTGILRIAEIEGGERRRGFTQIALAEMVDEIASVMEPVAEESAHRIVLGPMAGLATTGDPQLLTQMLLNLVENALRHTPPGGQITLSLVQEGSFAQLGVADTGPGIPADQRGVALRRFGRLGHHRAAGHGLGLPLVDAIARLHGGEMRLEDARPGLRVCVLLPLS